VLYVYAITDSPSAPRRSGLQGASVRVVGERGPFALMSEHRDLPPQPSEEDLWTHEAVVEDLMESSTVLPMRFGTRVADEAGLLAVLDERRDEFETAIERVRGAVELGVRAQIRTVEHVVTVAAGAGPGSAYLLERAARRRLADNTAARIHQPLARLARRSAARTNGLEPGVFKGAYLVDRDRVEAFRTRVSELTGEIDGASIVCTGPWPPYSFSSGERQ
jgi:gas vesicle protein GvpL/GvpF